MHAISVTIDRKNSLEIKIIRKKNKCKQINSEATLEASLRYYYFDIDLSLSMFKVQTVSTKCFIQLYAQGGTRSMLWFLQKKYCTCPGLCVLFWHSPWLREEQFTMVTCTPLHKTTFFLHIHTIYSACLMLKYEWK